MVIGPADTRVRERISRFPIDSKLSWSIPPFSDEATVSVSFDGSASGEVLAKDSASINIGNVWSLGMWIKTRTWSNATPDYLMELSSNSNRVRIQASTAGAFRLELTDSAAVKFKDYGYDGLLSLSGSAWDFIVITYNAGTLALYKNGVYVPQDDTHTDIAGTMTDTARNIAIGNWTADTTRAYDGNIFTVALWDAILDTTAMGVLYNQGVGFRVDWNRAYGTDYTNNTDLQHWWRLGHDSADIGKDYGNATAVDIDDDSNNIGVSDIFSDYPGA